MDKLIFRSNETSHDEDFKTPHRHVAITVDGWENSWNKNINEYMDLTGILPERIANVLMAAPALLEASESVLVAWQKLAAALPQDDRIEAIEFEEFNALRSAVAKAIGIQPWEVTKHIAALAESLPLSKGQEEGNG